MKATSFPLDEPGFTAAWAKLTHVLASALGGRDRPEGRPAPAATEPPAGILKRIDRWFWEQQLRDREAYLAQAQDVFDLEDRIRRLERSVRGWSY